MAETASKEKEKKSFFKGLKAEFGKVIWPTREMVIIALLDLVIKFGLSFIL